METDHVVQEAMQTLPSTQADFQDPRPSSPMDSKTALLDDLILEKLEDIFHRPPEQLCVEEILAIANGHSPIDLAHAVCRLPPPHRAVVFEHIHAFESRLEFIEAAGSDTRRAVLRELSDSQVKKILEAMPLDEAVSLMDELSERRIRRIMPYIEKARVAELRERASHERGTAARLMTSEFFALRPDMTVADAGHLIRSEPGIPSVQSLFVLSEHDELLGMVSARALIIHPESRKLRELMRPVFHTADPDTSSEEVIETIERYKIHALPVLQEGKMIGLITSEEALDALEDITDKTIARMAGTTEKVAEHQSSFKRFFARAPWLVVTLIAGLINMEVMSYFGRSLHYLMYFVPMINGLSGNIGLQCSTVLVRGIAIGHVSRKNQWKFATKEIVVGLGTGLAFGMLCGLILYSLGTIGLNSSLVSPFTIGLIVSGGLTAACIAATLLGVFAPLVFARVGIDPAIASGPIITALNDFLAMVIYFSIASILTIILT